jgi:acylphosphatase
MTIEYHESCFSSEQSDLQNQVRRKYKYTGRVQGVGFRATVNELAQGFAIHGWVKNCEDGSVECVVEGALPEIRAFDQIVRDSRSHYVHDVHTTKESWSGDLSGFEIKF